MAARKAGGGGLFSSGDWEEEIDVVEGAVVPWAARVPNRDRKYGAAGDGVDEDELGMSPPAEDVEEVILEEVNYDLTDIEFRNNFKAMKKVEWWDAPMKKTMREIRDMNLVEVMVEIRDMRLPKTGTHPLFRLWRRTKNMLSVVVYTHTENFKPEEVDAVRQYTMSELNIPSDQVFFEDLRGCKKYKTRTLRPLIMKIKEMVLRSGHPVRQQVKKAIVVGVPNVGKSSFIYIVSKELTKKKKKKKLYHAPVVADHAGETIRTKSYWFSEKPNIMLIDTPGLFPPASQVSRDPEAPYKLAATKSCNLPHIARDFDFMQVEVADYLLYKLNQAQKFFYVKQYGLKAPTDRIHRVLNHMNGNTDKQNALQFIDDFNNGYLGSIVFDDLTVVEDEWLQDENQFEMKPFEDRRRRFMDQPQEQEPPSMRNTVKKRQRITLKSDFWRDV